MPADIRRSEVIAFDVLSLRRDYPEFQPILTRLMENSPLMWSASSTARQLAGDALASQTQPGFWAFPGETCAHRDRRMMEAVRTEWMRRVYRLEHLCEHFLRLVYEMEPCYYSMDSSDKVIKRPTESGMNSDFDQVTAARNNLTLLLFDRLGGLGLHTEGRLKGRPHLEIYIKRNGLVVTANLSLGESNTARDARTFAGLAMIDVAESIPVECENLPVEFWLEPYNSVPKHFRDVENERQILVSSLKH